MKKYKFKKKNKKRANYTLGNRNFYISYNPHACTGMGYFEGGKQTALKHREGQWLILDGDFRKQYIKAFPKGYKECEKVYKRNINHRCKWSTDSLGDL